MSGTATSITRPLNGPTGRLVVAHRAEVLSVLRRHGVTNPRIFGSVARGDDHEGSDLDLLVDFPPGTSLVDVVGIQLVSRMFSVCPWTWFQPRDSRSAYGCPPRKTSSPCEPVGTRPAVGHHRCHCGNPLASRTRVSHRIAGHGRHCDAAPRDRRSRQVTQRCHESNPNPTSSGDRSRVCATCSPITTSRLNPTSFSPPSRRTSDRSKGLSNACWRGSNRPSTTAAPLPEVCDVTAASLTGKSP